MKRLTPLGDNRWRARAYLGRTPDGKLIQRQWVVEARTHSIALRLARQREAELLRDGRAGTPEPGNRSVRAAAEAWLQTIDPVARPKYHSESRRLLEADVYPVLGDKHVGRVTVAELERFWRWMGSQGKSSASIRAAAVALNQVWKVAVRYGWADSNPVKDAHRPTYRAPQISPPSRDEVMAILAAARGRSPMDARLFVVAAGSGLRRGELAAMRPSRLRDGRMVVDAAVSAVRGGDGVPIVKDPKTHQRRTVDLSPATQRAVVEQLVWLRDRARRAGVELVDDPWLWSFDLRGGVPPSPDYLSHAFSAACRLAGVKGVRLHDLRHFFATQSLAEGHAIPTVSGALGHRDSATTLRIYAHPDEAAMASLPGWVDEALGLTPELEAGT